VLFLQCPLWILDRPVMWHRENCGYGRITGCVKMNIVTNFLEQLNNGSRCAFLTPLRTVREPWEAAGVPRDFPKHLAVSITMGIQFHRPKDQGVISRLPDTFSTVFGPGPRSTQPTNHQNSSTVTLVGVKRLKGETVFQLPLMLWFKVCGGRLHLLQYSVCR
jgi:hypothetical protein